MLQGAGFTEVGVPARAALRARPPLCLARAADCDAGLLLPSRSRPRSALTSTLWSYTIVTAPQFGTPTSPHSPPARALFMLLLLLLRCTFFTLPPELVERGR